MLNGSGVEATLEEISEAWGSGIEEWDLLGPIANAENPHTVARFTPTTKNWNLKILDEDSGQWYSAIDGGVEWADVWAVAAYMRAGDL